MTTGQTITESPVHEVLSRVPGLSGLSPEVIEALASAAVPSAHRAGAVIFLQDEPARGVYVVRHGLVRISRLTEKGREHIMLLLESGESFNEVSALDGGPNPATAMAHTDCEVLCMCRADLLNLSEDYPELVWSLAGSVAGHARRMLDVVVDLAMHTVRGRLAKMLLSEAELHGSTTIPNYLTQEEMASRLGTVREMVGRAMRSLVAEGAIEIDRHRIVVLDPALLAKAAEE